MDQKKTGKFIAERRRAAGLTQEALGERLGVSNRTVSRWETGAYMPDLDSLLPFADILGVSVNELLAGERIAESAAFREQADRTLIRTLRRDSSYNWRERVKYFRRKWIQEHAPALVLLCVLYASLAVFAAIWKNPAVIAGLPLVGAVGYALVRNRMMIYVEARAFDLPEKTDGDRAG